jgi:hypothetical protein
MSTHVETFLCPHRETQMGKGQGAGPNWTIVQGPGPMVAGVVVLSCTNCGKAIGSYLYPPEEQGDVH